MKLDIVFDYKEQFLPTPRSRKLREQEAQSHCTVKIPEPKEFPVVLITSTLESYGAYPHKGGNMRMLNQEYRTFDDRLFKAVHRSSGAAISDDYKNVNEIAQEIKFFSRPVWNHGSSYYDNLSDGEFVPEVSVIRSDDRAERLRDVEQAAQKYVFYNNQFWREAGEPMYKVVTFGLGNNYGGTSIFVTENYNPNLSANCYFTALQSEDALAFAIDTALRRGDTESVDGLGQFSKIKVLMPELIRRNPAADLGGEQKSSVLNQLHDIKSQPGKKNFSEKPKEEPAL